MWANRAYYAIFMQILAQAHQEHVDATERLQAQLDASKSREDDTVARVASLQSEVMTLKKQLSGAQEKLEYSRKNNKTLVLAIRAAEKEIGSIQKHHVALEDVAAKARAELQVAVEARKEAQEDLLRLQVSCSTVQCSPDWVGVYSTQLPISRGRELCRVCRRRCKAWSSNRRLMRWVSKSRHCVQSSKKAVQTMHLSRLNTLRYGKGAPPLAHDLSPEYRSTARRSLARCGS